MKPARRSIFILSCLTATFLSAVFFIDALNRAGQKPFWGDEIFGLNHSIKAGALSLIVSGADGQGSPSPLDYLALKAFDAMKENVGAWGLSPEVYFRLWPAGVTALAGLLVFLLMARQAGQTMLHGDPLSAQQGAQQTSAAIRPHAAAESRSEKAATRKSFLCFISRGTMTRPHALLRKAKQGGSILSYAARNTRNGLTLYAVQMILICFFLVAFYYSGMVFYYAVETRPYALWNSLWLMALAVGLLQDKPKPQRFQRESGNRGRVLPFECCSLQRILWLSILVLLALSATASIFQIGMLALSWFIVHGGLKFLREGRNFADVAWDAARLFGPPLLVSVYYAVQAGSWDGRDSGGTWADFVKFWTHKGGTLVPLMLLLIAACALKREARPLMVVPFSVLLLYLIGPAIFAVTAAQGFFYAERQYIYYDLTNGVFMLTLCRLLPEYAIPQRLTLKGRAPWIILVVTLAIGAAVTFRLKVVKKWSKVTEGALKSMRVLTGSH